MPLLFRFHKGSLQESMNTIREIPNYEFLEWLIRYTSCIPAIDGISINYYCYDERIDWDTYIVSADYKSNDRISYPVGFLNKKPTWWHDE